MAALLVALAVMAVLMSVALPVWRHEAQREKEEELVFRGQQYIRAIRLFQRRPRPCPTSVDMLVQGHYLRKKYKDPITNDDFEYLGAATRPGQPGQPGQAQPGSRAAAAAPQPAGGGSDAHGPAPARAELDELVRAACVSGGTVPGGMMGVRSKSKDESIRLYLGRNHYNEWTFIFASSSSPAGRAGAGSREARRPRRTRRPTAARCSRAVPGGGPGGRGAAVRRGGPGGGPVSVPRRRPSRPRRPRSSVATSSA